MYRAHLCDPIHGEAEGEASTALEAVEIAFRKLAANWMTLPNGPAFDGEIRRDIEVWWHNRAWGLIGTVVPTNDTI